MNGRPLSSFVSAVAACWGLSLAAVGLSAQSYSIRDLGTLGGPSSVALAVNDRGQVVGWAQTGEVGSDGDLVLHAFLWLPSPAAGMEAGMHDLGTLGGDDSRALDLNENLQVVGSAQDGTVDAFGNFIDRPFLWQLGSMTDLGTANAGYFYGQARSINELGQVVGGEFTFFFCQPFLWLPEPAYGLPAGIQTLPRAPGHAEGEAFAINDAGEVASRSTVACDTTAGTATLWLPAAAHGLPAGVHNLASESPPERGGEARALNSLGAVVGRFEDDDFNQELFSWRDGVRTSLPILDGANVSSVVDINDQGEVVGGATLFGPPVESVPLIWRNGQPTPLQDLLPAGTDWDLTTVTGINNRGQIVGHGRLGGVDRAFLLTPLLFGDGFESGDTSAWSAVVGGP